MSPVIGLLFCVAAFVSGEVSYSLDSADLNGPWKLQNQNQSKLRSFFGKKVVIILAIGVKTSGRVPGGVYSDLFDTGVLDNSVPLFYRRNDLDYRWVSLDNWTYSRTFDIPDDVLGKTVVNLVLHGVDTVAEVALNGQVLGSVDNMFVRYIFPIKAIAKVSGFTKFVQGSSFCWFRVREI